MPISITADINGDVENLDFEVAERKGVGHPDTICDAIAERASRRYAKYCLSQFGGVAHHWFDKVMLVGGEAHIEYGRGELIRPYNVLYAGKGAFNVGDTKIPLEGILFDAAAEVLSSVLTGFDSSRHLSVTNLLVDHQGAGRQNSRYRPRSPDDLVSLDADKRVSNDCNLLTAFAPVSRLERMVLYVERFLNGTDYKGRNPNSGWDVKIVGTRHRQQFNLLVNMPFLANVIHSYDDYLEAKAVAGENIRNFVQDKLGLDIHLTMNTTDRNGRPYLTALGSVADTGDVGVVGRGNRINGLITPMRPMSIEASAGKNPIDHTGKIYSLLAHDIANEVFNTYDVGCRVFVTTSKEAPLKSPDEVKIILATNALNPLDQDGIHELVERRLSEIGSLTEELIFGERELW